MSFMVIFLMREYTIKLIFQRVGIEECYRKVKLIAEKIIAVKEKGD